MDDFWDEDIANLKLSKPEKDGLQVFRNYKRVFYDHAEKKFSEQVNAEAFDLTPLRQITSLLTTEDVRFLPVMVCAFADEMLKEMFKAQVPDKVPGGASALFGPYGPFSSLFNRLQLSYVFDMISNGVLLDLDRVRKVRNDLSHMWDIRDAQDFHTKTPANEIYAIDTLLCDRPEFLISLAKLDTTKTFRVRLIWLAWISTARDWPNVGRLARAIRSV